MGGGGGAPMDESSEDRGGNARGGASRGQGAANRSGGKFDDLEDDVPF